MPKPKRAGETPQPTPPPLRNTMVSCRTCGQTICVAVWRTAPGTKKVDWVEQTPPVEPFSGEPHDCNKALARWVPIARYLRGEIFSCDVKLLDGSHVIAWLDPSTGALLPEEAACPPRTASSSSGVGWPWSC